MVVHGGVYLYDAKDIEWRTTYLIPSPTQPQHGCNNRVYLPCDTGGRDPAIVEYWLGQYNASVRRGRLQWWCIEADGALNSSGG